MFAEMRTGSNFLEANLNALPGVTCHGEVFNPHFIGKKDQTELFGIDMAAREADPLALLRRLRDRTEGLSGFRYFHDHDPRICDEVLNDPACAKIILTRNPVESYVSWKIAQETGQWKLTNAKNLKTARARFDAGEFERHLEALQQFQIRLMHGLQITGQTAFYIDYDDINDIAVLNGLAAFLGVTARLESTDDKLKKQNPEEISEKVLNPAEMEAALARLDRFNLSRTPNFEPRRAAGIPSFLAARGAPILFMPIRSGPEAEIAGWLDQLGGTEGGFVQKSLRQWKRSRPGHRSFTVLRHPLARAHAAFAHLLAHNAPDLRNAMARIHGLKLPRPGEGFDDIAEHRAAFLAFLRFLKLHVSGQTGIRLEANHATQSAILQGFASFQGPDLVLREDRLDQGLALLAAEVGSACPPLPSAAEPDGPPLAELWGPDVEDAARDAYQRDYVGLGFGPWRA